MTFADPGIEVDDRVGPGCGEATLSRREPIGDRLHHHFYRGLAQLPGRARRHALRRVFDITYRRSDPWAYWTDLEAQRHAAIVAACGVEPVNHALEVGCGEGVLTRRLLHAGVARWITGIDVSDRAVGRALAAMRGEPASYLAGDVRTCSLPDPVDLVICADVLYYLPDDVAALGRRLAAVLQIGGALLLCHPRPRAAMLHEGARLNGRLRVVDEHTAILRTGAQGSNVPYLISRLVRCT